MSGSNPRGGTTSGGLIWRGMGGGASGGTGYVWLGKGGPGSGGTGGTGNVWLGKGGPATGGGGGGGDGGQPGYTSITPMTDGPSNNPDGTAVSPYKGPAPAYPWTNPFSFAWDVAQMPYDLAQVTVTSYRLGVQESQMKGTAAPSLLGQMFSDVWQIHQAYYSGLFSLHAPASALGTVYREAEWVAELVSLGQYEAKPCPALFDLFGPAYRDDFMAGYQVAGTGFVIAADIAMIVYAVAEIPALVRGLPALINELQVGLTGGALAIELSANGVAAGALAAAPYIGGVLGGSAGYNLFTGLRDYILNNDAPARELEINPNRGWKPGASLSEAEAVEVVRGGGDVIASDPDTARRIAELAGDGPPLFESPHGPGQRPHFHPTRGGQRAGGHVLY